MHARVWGNRLSAAGNGGAPGDHSERVACVVGLLPLSGRSWREVVNGRAMRKAGRLTCEFGCGDSGVMCAVTWRGVPGFWAQQCRKRGIGRSREI